MYEFQFESDREREEREKPIVRDYLALSERERIAVADQVIAERERRKFQRRCAAFLYGCAMFEGSVIAFTLDGSLEAFLFSLAIYLWTAAYAALLLDRGLRKSAVEIEFGV